MLVGDSVVTKMLEYLGEQREKEVEEGWKGRSERSWERERKGEEEGKRIMKCYILFLGPRVIYIHLAMRGGSLKKEPRFM